MSDLETRILEAQAHFGLLRSVHYFVSLSLPIPEDVENKTQTAESQIKTDMLVNDITILRSDIKCLPIRLEQIDIDQITNDADVDRLIGAFDSLLRLFEDSVLGLEETREPNLTIGRIFPKLFTLRSLRQQYDKVTEKNDCGVDDPETSADGRSTTPNNTVLLGERKPLFRLGEITSYIEFPPQGKTIAQCRGTIESFGKVIADVFPDAVRRWNVESRLEEVTDAEIESINEADAFSKTSSSLFRHLVSCITCEAEHVARLHLSGFPTQRLEMLLGTDKHGWIPALFTPSPPEVVEDVAALGVLILELEANLSAGWTSDDEDYFTGEKSNKARLSRILKEWKGDLTDFYRGIGSACFRFEELVEDFEHPRVDPSLTSLAILYKCIVNPLYQKLVSDHGETQRLFQGTPGFCIPTMQKRASGSGCIILYDDGESTEPDTKSEYATKLMRTLENGFLSSIRALRQNSQPIGLAESLQGMQTPEKIRIAVLDTGIDETDKMIKAAILRIKDMRSWVGSPGNYTDTYGHGTHVTRLLLQMAPAADIYIAKITDNKNVNPEDMSRIAEAIDWAVKEWNVHIISMSFGFGHHNKAIDDAIERAFKADKLMLAAASNEGGNKGRARPGRNPRVICIHACDGNGNKGDMSPSPMRNKNNFTTLGVAVQSRWRKQIVYKSGTSFATPVAAAIAADLLEFANFKCKLAEEDKQLLYKHDGMEAVFRAMSTERDSYDYVQPGHLWDGKDDNEVAKVIQDILAEL
ncbi:hypothetical protein N0V84_001224 [Fusarium piperis]|uniref:Peptidase S8/S53 domain-containing protein n=1 Tax=Fusarium piperis TaxID=1435070 RepID=A0A9W9BST2_9HYPO|nr:hypothetical protein N0V84_001224 [Fusarium piperis]